MNPHTLTEQALIDLSAVQRAPLKPVNGTKINHRGMNRRTDLSALQEHYRPGSIEWTREWMNRNGVTT